MIVVKLLLIYLKSSQHFNQIFNITTSLILISKQLDYLKYQFQK